jgi:hypothetical protein
MVRVCQDVDACEATTAVKHAAVQCNPTKRKATATVSFSCPPSGLYNLMKAVSGTSSPPDVLPALSASSGPLQDALSGQDLVGLYLHGEENEVANPKGGLFRITQVSTRLNVPETQDYVVQKQKVDAAGNTTWDHLCRPASVSDPDISAIALTGKWNHTGDWQDDGTVFTFACRRGVQAKCYEWGYVPWQPDRRVYHQTCTRVARADYCGIGDAHTVDGTVIDIEDVPISTSTSGTLRTLNTICTTQLPQGVPGATCSLDPSLFLLESVWALDTQGASVNACGETRLPPKILCLSKKRWESIPLGGYCPDTLVDPRVNDCRNDPQYAMYYCNRTQTKGLQASGSGTGISCDCEHCECQNGHCGHDNRCHCQVRVWR